MLEDIKLEQAEPEKHSEEQLQRIQDWIDNPITQNLATHLREKIEKGKMAWIMGSFIAKDQVNNGIADAAYCQALSYILNFIESGGVNDVNK